MWTWILSMCIGSTIIMSLALCLCWRKKAPKNEWLGLDGLVTQKNPDENVNHLPSAAPCVVDGVNVIERNADLNNKRNLAPTNTRRSLPDIPFEQGTNTNWEPTGDNSSEHYATVGQYQLNNAKRHTLPNGVEARPSMSQHSSISQTDDSFSPYERVKYDKIKSKEHPYAQVQPSTSRVVEENGPGSVEERINLLRVEEPLAPPRSRRSSEHSTLAVDIPAASAVAGGIAASPELPYMTPPVTQPNFSGDSQDSSKGYTSISVREPLANIRAQTKDISKKQPEIDPHYATVSDDSDDVYTTIPDPNNQIYTSESETYARIPTLPITVEVDVNPTPNRNCQSSIINNQAEDELYEPPPQPPPPSVDSLKQVTSHSHSRQASSSSSIANIGSPKPEKRQVNSPLPPPPSQTTNFDFHSDKIQIQKNLDDLYAKVQKNKRKDDFEFAERSPDKIKLYLDDSNNCRKSSSNSCDDRMMKMNQNDEHNYETLKKLRKSSDAGYERIKHEEPGYASINGPDSITNTSDPGYEQLKCKPLSETDSNYEELRHTTSNASDCSSLAGYTKIKCTNNIIDGYSVVNKQRNKNNNDISFTSSSYGETNSQDLSLDEPNYESMPSETPSSEHNYYAALKSGSDTDPNYETVASCQNDPNYESVSSVEPPYERLTNDDDSSRADSMGYEKIKNKSVFYDTSEGSNDTGSISKDPPYEQIINIDDVPDGYEKINSNNKWKNQYNIDNEVEPNYSTINKNDQSGNITDEEAIYQV